MVQWFVNYVVTEKILIVNRRRGVAYFVAIGKRWKNDRWLLNELRIFRLWIMVFTKIMYSSYALRFVPCNTLRSWLTASFTDRHKIYHSFKHLTIKNFQENGDRDFKNFKLISPKGSWIYTNQAYLKNSCDHFIVQKTIHNPHRLSCTSLYL